MVTPVFLVPALTTMIEKMGMTPTRAPAKTALELSLILFQLYLAIPICLSIYPRMGTIAASDLEPEYQNLKGSDGKIITEFSFNKGL